MFPAGNNQPGDISPQRGVSMVREAATVKGRMVLNEGFGSFLCNSPIGSA